MNVEELRLPLPYPDVAQMSPQAIKKALIELIQQETSEFHDALMQTVDMNLLARQRKAEAVWNTYLLSMQHIAKRNEEDLLAQIGSLFPNQTHLSAANIIDAANRSAYAILHVGVQKENFSRSNLFRAFDCDKTTRALVLDQCKNLITTKDAAGLCEDIANQIAKECFRTTEEIFHYALVNLTMVYAARYLHAIR